MQEKELMSARDIWKSKKIYWITTYKTLLKYIKEDYTDILKPIVKGAKSGKRYYVKKENLDIFINMFETNQLIDK